VVWCFHGGSIKSNDGDDTKGAGIYWMLCWCSKGGNGVGKFSAAVVWIRVWCVGIGLRVV